MGGFIFKWGVCPVGYISFDGGGGGGSKKIVGWETLYMENFMQIMDDSKQ